MPAPDGSAAILRDFAEKSGASLAINAQKNSGRVFQPVAKGLEMARGQYVWIAEADDLCARRIFWRQCWAMSGQKPALFMRFPQIIDGDGNISAIDYRQNYLTYASSERWVKAMMWPAARKFFRPGHSLRRALTFRRPCFAGTRPAWPSGEAQKYRCSGELGFLSLPGHAGQDFILP